MSERQKKVFNYRLSRARRYIECCFGILASKWRIFQRPLNVDIDLAECIVKAACILQNFVRQRHGGRDDTNGLELCHFPSIDKDSLSRANKNGLTARDKFADYFVEVSPLPWQHQSIR
ncbi:unnamed protein product [Acanthoscelides obtectus]|uniref:DDE Tnp4 domain-containing protein n=1 Tax=Acanthoscelides obtectus TaxID=200917 RepID=A0A9P0KQH0_ACAOB|nr:unnamed protein product [Acanthoscelides obtectus]CAK1682106.1 hypothetical protein AOBTE_LOCUS33429 [Acanthoscelides obtectus]